MGCTACVLENPTVCVPPNQKIFRESPFLPKLYAVGNTPSILTEGEMCAWKSHRLPAKEEHTTSFEVHTSTEVRKHDALGFRGYV